MRTYPLYPERAFGALSLFSRVLRIKPLKVVKKSEKWFFYIFGTDIFGSRTTLRKLKVKKHVS